MLDHLPGCDPAPGSPSHRPHQQPPVGDVTRSDSYSLVRGGKVVSSRPWAAGGALHGTLHAHGKSPSDTRTPGSPSGGSSSSSDSDDRRHFRGGVRGARERGAGRLRPLHHPGGGPRGSGGRRVRQRAAPPGRRDTRGHTSRGKLGQARDSDAQCERGDESESDDDDDDDSESDETESTVRARLQAVSGCGEGHGHTCGEEHNDTLSTVSDDLSFDDGDPSSPAGDQEAAAAIRGDSTPAHVTPTPAHVTPTPAHMTPTAAVLRRDSAQDREVAAAPAEGERRRRAAGGVRVPPEGERCRPQREGVRAGVFCLSGYPRQEPPHSPLNPVLYPPSTLQTDAPGHRVGETGEDGRLTGDAPHSWHQHGHHHPSTYQNPRPQPPFPPRVTGAHTRGAQLSGVGASRTHEELLVAPRQAPALPLSLNTIAGTVSGQQEGEGGARDTSQAAVTLVTQVHHRQQQDAPTPQQAAYASKDTTGLPGNITLDKLTITIKEGEVKLGDGDTLGKELVAKNTTTHTPTRAHTSTHAHREQVRGVAGHWCLQAMMEHQEVRATSFKVYASGTSQRSTYTNGDRRSVERVASRVAAASSSRAFLREKCVSSSRQYHSDDSAVRGPCQPQHAALRRLFHSLSDYSMYPTYLTGLGLSTIVPSVSGEGVYGGSGRGTLAHAAPPTSPTPRLLGSTSGLSGSTSRLGGGLAAGAAYGGGLTAATRLGGSYTALASTTSSGYGSGAAGAAVASSRHEDSEDLSDVSSGATSEDSARRRRRRSAQSMKGEASVSGNEDFEWVRGSPMLTGLLEGHVTRLATPPDHRTHSLRATLATPPESGEEGVGASTHRHRQYTRPPPAPRPRTLEAGDLLPHRPVRDGLRDGLRDSRDGLRDRLYSPCRELVAHRRSRDSSVERSGRDSSCERGSVSSLHQHSHHHHHHLTPRLPHQHPCDSPSCWCDDDEPGYDSCDERHHHHRHSYHEGLQHAHLHHLQPHHHHPHLQAARELSRDRRNRGHTSADSGRSSPSCCRHCNPLGSLSSLSSHDYCSNTRLALPCTAKVGGRLATPQRSRPLPRLDSDYITLWSCHSPPGSSVEERVSRLEGDKESLQLQVTVLSEQVEAQTEKIADLESLLQQKKDQLHKSEEQLQKEAMARSSLETQCLELVSEISNLKLRQAAYERENIDLREKIRRSDHQSDHAKAQPAVSGACIGRTPSIRSVTPAAASTPIHSFLVTPDSPPPSHQLAAQLTNSPSPSSISTLSTIPASSPTKSPAQPTTASPASSPVASHDTREFMPPRTPPPNARRKIDQFGTVPRQREAGVCGENNHGAPSSGRSKGVMFGKGFHFLPFRVAGKRSTSAPNLAETEMQMIDDLSEGDYYPQVDGVVQSASSSPRCNTLTGHRSPPTHPKATGIKKIFTRLRRSSSGHLDSDLGEGDFRRGGMRATASARLGWTSPTTSFKEPNEAFTGWSIETIEAWFGALGLSQYCSGVRAWSSSGHHLSRATQQQLERELGIRHPLHRKKLQLAIAARLSGDQINTPLARLDHSWVLRWLDDVGLPQYKDSFSEARIDGRVLNCLTYDDLSFLRLSNLLHVTSLKRGIQVLREHNFDPSVLKRRSVPDEGQRIRTQAEVALWTNHRVMEWLRTVDLSEYAPNLRGSGVHGALMVYEVRFTSELLASLLSIPCGKTLLRRHLNTHFKELVGRSVVQEKRELEAASGYTPLTTSAKVKMPKKSQFSLKRKKSKSDLEFDDLLCPLDEKPPVGALQDKDKEVRTRIIEKISCVMIEKDLENVLGNSKIFKEKPSEEED
ncbi:LOW QUALITY PROTEIN: uncharacterized protein Liprin-beta [Procambarus clarkii]|uniref:LOW QUALITY PROTEIN: uncharacterized protein Liprin-beta n=1 Tax=Procambarus clarkii TaxID=6728 RepID=UPI00374321CA